jgi:hypothetical protein
MIHLQEDIEIATRILQDQGFKIKRVWVDGNGALLFTIEIPQTTALNAPRAKWDPRD